MKCLMMIAQPSGREKKIQINTYNDQLNLCRYVCEAVSRRASMMASAGITALLKKMDYKDVVIAIDGSLFR